MENWKRKLKQLEKITVERCLKLTNFETVVKCSFCHVLDTSDHGHGEVSFVHLVDKIGRIHCTLVNGKARVAPLKFMTILRMELVAATVSVKISMFLTK